MAGASFPVHNCPVGKSYSLTRYHLISASLRNPYSIPGLVESSLLIEILRGNWLVRSSWDRLGCKVYSEDRLKMSTGRGFMERTVFCFSGAGIEIKRVKDYGSESLLSLNCGLSVDAFGITVLGLESDIELSGLHDRGSYFSLKLSAYTDLSGFPLLLNLNINRTALRSPRLAALIDLTGSFFLIAGYRFDTGEVSGGILNQGSRMIVSVSWSNHPVLGLSYSAGGGLIWK
jgi:hypothetical protein